MTDPRLERWLAALESRHLAELAFREVTRALRALSATYVERRTRLATHGGFDTAGKRAAYALYYSPLHYLTMREIVRALDATAVTGPLLDLGCGAGAAGAACAVAASERRVLGIDAHPWAVREAAWTYRSFDLDGDARRASAAHTIIPRPTRAIVAGWVINELDPAARAAVRSRLLDSSATGVDVLIVEPIATRVSPWWRDWSHDFESRGGRADEWRFDVPLPDLVIRLARAAGLRVGALKARSLYLRGVTARSRAPGMRSRWRRETSSP